ncbi:MAG: hypothetical protein JRM99_06870 [Nitrososphaerota archaeon]|nr:hypothetical protein [Nitrososphaerota archaeon]
MTRRRGIIRERMLRVLFNNPSGTLTKYRIAKEAGGTYPWVHALLTQLQQDGLVKGTGVKESRELMALWQKWRLPPETRDYMLRKPLSVFSRADLDYALTTYQAENLVQNYLFPSRIDFYVHRSDLAGWHDLLVREGLVGKGNTRLLLADEHVFYNSSERGGFRVVSIPQLIVDLLAEGGVCVEAAEMLMEKKSKRGKDVTIPEL